MLASVKALLSGIVDYAGLFPPAKLSLPEAIANYAQYHQEPNNWMLGRFILPIAKLSDFQGLITKITLPKWNLSLILSQDWQRDLEQVEFLKNPALAVNSLEFPVLEVKEIYSVLKALPEGIETFFEIPLHEDRKPYLQVLSDRGVCAKIRTGGMNEAAFPNPLHLSECLLALGKAQLAFKATAGLHHPLPGWHQISHEVNSPITQMHGFLNLAILAALIYHRKIIFSEVVEVLQTSNFQFNEDGINWSNCQLSITELEVSRDRFFRSFGSCSFREPVEDLKELQLINRPS
ncbi:hypothetical protein [Merismopedia glauca]|uniref:Uncharacterized protein n=1 Tax=Merismopedia glauca CCAP 1448/3 TaxID=1296344 RepID=A0A2T1C2E9_9CYAN|nr:hypothetical protein [Merismopedia glauca]PSB02455.1 hypothetical protein C7B64_12980 [Merismopedia glauca CCAP 1448/3]